MELATGEVMQGKVFYETREFLKTFQHLGSCLYLFIVKQMWYTVVSAWMIDTGKSQKVMLFVIIELIDEIYNLVNVILRLLLEISLIIADT